MTHNTAPLIMPNGHVSNPFHKSLNLPLQIMKDETGAIVGLEYGDLTMAESLPLIKAMRDEQLLKKAQATKPTMRKSVAHKPATLEKSFTTPKATGFEGLLAQTQELQMMQRRLFG